MLQTLFKRARDDDWSKVRPRIERTCGLLFAGIGLQAKARALRVPYEDGSLLLVELISDVHWTSESFAQAKEIILRGLNSELGFKLRQEDLVIGFSKATAQPAREPAPARKRASEAEDFASSVIVTEVGNSQWSAFGPTAADATASEGPQTIAVPPRRRRP